MNKSFLSKKSWHTGTLSNIEKVWKAERAHEIEQKKIKQYLKEIEEQRQIEELRKLHSETTGLTRQERLDWLYQEPINTGPSPEEYMTGKAYKDPEKENELKQLKDKPGSLWFNQPKNDAVDMVTKIRDDPLFAIKQEEKKKRDIIKDNPIRMREIKAKLMEELKMKEKKKKKEKKHKKDKKRKRDEDKTNNEETDRETKRQKNERTARDDKQLQTHTHTKEINSEEFGVEKVTKSSSEISREQNNTTTHRGRLSRSRSRSRTRTRSKSRSRSRSQTRTRSHSRSHSRSQTRTRSKSRSRSRSQTRTRSKSRSRSRSRMRSPPPKNRHSARSISRERIERQNVEEKNQSNGITRNNRRRKVSMLTEEERNALLEQMKRDAQAHIEHRIQQMRKRHEEQQKEDEEFKNRTNIKDEIAPHFISSIGRSVYTDKTTASVADRVKRKIFYNERGNLDERGLFK
jgi:hypothetical protein